MAYPNSIEAICAKFAEQFCATIATVIQEEEVMQQARNPPTEHADNQVKNQVQPKLDTGQHQLQICVADERWLKMKTGGSHYADSALTTLQTQFGSSSYEDPETQFSKLVQTTSVADYEATPTKPPDVTYYVFDEMTECEGDYEEDDHEEFQTKIDDPNPHVHQVRNESVHDMLPRQTDNSMIREFCANKKGIHIANKMFDKITERRQYIASLNNPDPPDEYDQRTTGGTIEQLDLTQLLLQRVEILKSGNVHEIRVAHNEFDEMLRREALAWNVMIFHNLNKPMYNDSGGKTMDMHMKILSADDGGQKLPITEISNINKHLASTDDIIKHYWIWGNVSKSNLYELSVNRKSFDERVEQEWNSWDDVMINIKDSRYFSSVYLIDTDFEEFSLGCAFAIWVYSSGLLIYGHVAALIALIKHRDSGEFVSIDRIIVVSITHGIKFSSYTVMCSKQFMETNLMNMVGYNLSLVALGCCSLPFILGCSKGVEIYLAAQKFTVTSDSRCLKLIVIHAEWKIKGMLGSKLLLLVHSLYLPYEFLKNLIGDLKEWWKFKPKHMDKVGKFNELLRMNKSISVLCNFLEKMEILPAKIKYLTWYNILAALEQRAMLSHVLVWLPKIVVVVTMFCSFGMLCAWMKFMVNDVFGIEHRSHASTEGVSRQGKDSCHAFFALHNAGYENIMRNSNPETVSTYYDTSDHFYFEPLTVEDVLNIIDLEQHDGMLYCSLCEVEVFKYNKHCRVCDKCVDRFDHHCCFLEHKGFAEDIASKLGSSFSVVPYVIVVCNFSGYIFDPGGNLLLHSEMRNDFFLKKNGLRCLDPAFCKRFGAAMVAFLHRRAIAH